MTHDPSSWRVIERFYQAETAYMVAEPKDFGPLAATLHPDCRIHQPASLPYGGIWKGHDGFEKWMMAFSAQWSRIDIRDSKMFFTDGDAVFSLSQVYAVARATGLALDWPLLQYFRILDGRIAELRPFHWDTAAMLPALS